LNQRITKILFVLSVVGDDLAA